MSKPKPVRRSASRDPLAWSPEQGWAGITPEDRAAWATAYPAVNLDSQLAAAEQWLRANPSKAKKRLWRKFITGWFSRTQERGGHAKSNPVGFSPGVNVSHNAPPSLDFIAQSRRSLKLPADTPAPQVLAEVYRRNPAASPLDFNADWRRYRVGTESERESIKAQLFGAFACTSQPATAAR